MFCMAYMWLSLAPRPLPQSSLGTRLTCGYATAVCVHWTMTMYNTISMCAGSGEGIDVHLCHGCEDV